MIRQRVCVKTPVGAMSTYYLLVIALYLAAKFINFPGKIQNLAAKFIWRPKSIKSKLNSELIPKISFQKLWKLIELFYF